jgi:hypothetical protein
MFTARARSIARRSFFCSEHDFLRHFGENHAPLDVGGALLTLDLAPL